MTMAKGIESGCIPGEEMGGMTLGVETKWSSGDEFGKNFEMIEVVLSLLSVLLLDRYAETARWS